MEPCGNGHIARRRARQPPPHLWRNAGLSPSAARRVLYLAAEFRIEDRNRRRMHRDAVDEPSAVLIAIGQ
jgi:hypothetical protein